jgi:hypothetical protein
MAAPLALIALPALGNAPADSVSYKAPGEWVAEPPTTNVTEFSADRPFQFVYLDNQVREAKDGTEEVYTAYRLKILKPEALSAGNVTVTWQPEDGPATIHYVRLIRAGQSTDVLATVKFSVVQREAQLEQSMLTGQRTAILQVPGMQVGDELAVAMTIKRHQKIFGGHVSNMMQMPVLGSKGAYRFRLLWPADQQINFHASNDLTLPQPTVVNGEHSVELTLRDPVGAVPTEGAPARFNIRRLIAFSNYASWAELSGQLAPLFDHAATIAPDSPLQAEVAAIAARAKDPTERAQAALQLVEDRTRYVYVGLNGGNFTPATADETWQRRFGDCKGKAVLLVALLRSLGIEAEVALVNSKGGDAIDQVLPGPQWFDHVIVRAVIAGKVFWLDSTRVGDRYLDNLPSPYRWALPLRAQGAELWKIEPQDSGFPALIGIVDIDATAGTDQDATVSVRNVLRGDEAYAIRAKLAALSADDADRALKSYWHQQLEWATPDKVTWSYSERRMAITLGMVGRGNPGWEGDSGQGHSLTLLGAGFYKPDPMRRPLDQDQAAGWAVEFPRFRCYATTVRLPRAGGKFTWSLFANPVDRKLGGTVYWRASGFNKNIVRTVMSSHNYESEVSPQEAVALNQAISRFNDKMSNVAEEAPGSVLVSLPILPFGEDVDWVNSPSPCSPK